MRKPTEIRDYWNEVEEAEDWEGLVKGGNRNRRKTKMKESGRSVRNLHRIVVQKAREAAEKRKNFIELE